jgi:hypothetical protein
MTGQTTRKRLPDWAINLGMGLGGMVIAVLLAQAAVALFPGLLPRFLRPDPYDQRTARPDDLEITYRVGNGDLFIAQPGSVTPPDNPDEVLTQFALSYDENGFRRPIMDAERYSIVTLGDSFTDDAHVSVPWPDVLASELNTPVQNLGFQGYGPEDYARVMTLFGTAEPRAWVVIGFFEGNDLPATIVDEQEGLTLPQVARQAFLAARGDYTTPDFGEGPWKYPVEMRLGNQTHPLNLFEFYLWFLNGDLEIYERSAELAALGEHLGSIQADAGDACVLLAYLPNKAHIYFPYIADPAGQASVLSSAWALTLDAENRLEAVPTPTTPEDLASRLDNQSLAVKELAEEMSVYFVDVTTPMEEAAARGEVIYYTYDTHWTPRGHEIAGRAIADFIEEHPECGA